MCFCHRRPVVQLVGRRSGWRTGSDLFGRGSKPAVFLPPAAKLCGPQTAMRLRCCPKRMVLDIVLACISCITHDFDHLFFPLIALTSRTRYSSLLTHKKTLPVRSLVLGDVRRPGSESAYRLGHLQCHGNSKSIIIFKQSVKF